MQTIREICRKSLLGLLYPLARYCVKHSLKYQEVIEYLKLAFIDVAQRELRELDQSITPSKISAMTGIQRREVSRLLEDREPSKQDQDVISRVIGLWQNGKRFKDAVGKPRTLTFTGREGDFAELVSLVSTDLNPYTVAFELERIGVVTNTKAGLKLKKPGYEPDQDIEASLRLLAEDNNILFSAVSENIFESHPIKNFHAKTQFDNIPAEYESQIRNWFLQKGGEFHHQAREYLSSFDRDVDEEIRKKHPDGESICAAIGTVSFSTSVSKPKEEIKD